MATKKKAKFRINEIVSIPWDKLKHQVKSKRQDSRGNWHYYLTNISGEFSEIDLSKPRKSSKKTCR